MTTAAFEPRIWTYDVPPPAEFVTANGRLHWRAEAEQVSAWRTASWAAAKKAKLPVGLHRVRVDITIYPPNTKDRDAPNLDLTCKPLVDGLGPPFVRMPSRKSNGAAAVGYRLIPNDNAKHLDGHHLHVAEPAPPRGRVTITIVDLTGVPAGRTWTPDLPGGGRTRVAVKRPCNGCARLLGDITHEEVAAAVHGQPLPDVTGECPDCSGVSRG